MTRADLRLYPVAAASIPGTLNAACRRTGRHAWQASYPCLLGRCSLERLILEVATMPLPSRGSGSHTVADPTVAAGLRPAF